MKISIIVPIYNAENYLTQCIDSILAYSGENLEVILVNDGSTDQSKTIGLQYESCDSRVIFVDQKNQGVSAARNNGIMRATGKWITFLDADDYFVDGYFEQIQKEVSADCDFIGFSDYSMRENQISEDRYPFEGERTQEQSIVQQMLLGTHLLHTCWGKVYRRDILMKYGICFPENIRIGEDYLFVLEYFRHVKCAKLVNAPLLYYRINTQSVMQHYNKESRFETWKMLTSYCGKYYREQKFNFDECFYLHQLKNTTSYLYDLCRNTPYKESKNKVEALLDSNELKTIISHINIDQLGRLKGFEYWIIKKERPQLICIYFKAKSRFQKKG